MQTDNKTQIQAQIRQPAPLDWIAGSWSVISARADRYLLRIPVALVLALAIFAFIGIIFPANHSLWLDEAVSYYFATAPSELSFEIIRKAEANMALYYALLKLHLLSGFSSLYYIRGLSAIFGFLSIVFMFLFARNFIGRWVALWVAVIAAFNPFIFSYSWEARSYSLTLLFGSVMLWLFWLAMTENRRVHWILYGVVGGLGLYSHIFLALMLVAQGAFALLYVGLNRNLSKYIGNCLQASAVLIAVAAPILYFFVTVGSTASNLDWIQPVGISHTWGFLKNILKTNYTWEFVPRVLSILLLVAVFALSVAKVVGEYSRGKLSKRGYLILYLWTCTILPVLLTYALQLIKPMFMERYLIYVVPSFLILCCWAILSVSRARIRYALLCCLCVTQAYGLYGSHNAEKDGYDNLYAELSALCEPGSSLVFTFSSVASTYSYYVDKYPRLSHCFSAVTPGQLDRQNFNRRLEFDQLPLTKSDGKLWVVDAHASRTDRSIVKIYDQAYLAKRGYRHSYYKKYPRDLTLIRFTE